jgi:hypothetical protein
VAIRLDDFRNSAQRWAKVPRSTTEDSGLPDGEYRLLCFLIDHGNGQGWSLGDTSGLRIPLGPVHLLVRLRTFL